MKIKLRFFSSVQNYFKASEKEIEIHPPKTVLDIFESLFEEKQTPGKMLPFLRVAVNREFVPIHTVVQEGDEIAFIPPVSGG